MKYTLPSLNLMKIGAAGLLLQLSTGYPGIRQACREGTPARAYLSFSPFPHRQRLTVCSFTGLVLARSALPGLGI